MIRLVLLALLAGCAHEVTEPNPPGPPGDLGGPYSGRIVLQSSSLRDEVQGFRTAWTRRLTIMGVGAKITYDDDRAIIDVYGAPDLNFVAQRLADPSIYSVDGYPINGTVDAWFMPDATCGCSARVWVQLTPAQMCNLQNGVHSVNRNGGMLSEITTKKFWHVIPSERFYDSVPGGSCDVPNQWFIHHLLVGLPPASTPQQNMQTVLALGGGALPTVPILVSVTPRGGQ